jgi:anti-sigma factor RsiW
MTATTQHAFEPEELMAYLDGELEPRRAAALGSHLDHCADCHALASQIRAVTERLLHYQVEAISPSANASMIEGQTE